MIYKAVKPRIFFAMNLITTIIKPDADGTLHLPLPIAWRHQAIRVRAELEPIAVESEPVMQNSAENLKGFGCLRGKISLSPDFDEPLKDFEDYMA